MYGLVKVGAHVGDRHGSHRITLTIAFCTVSGRGHHQLALRVSKVPLASVYTVILSVDHWDCRQVCYYAWLLHRFSVSELCLHTCVEGAFPLSLALALSVCVCVCVCIQVGTSYVCESRVWRSEDNLGCQSSDALCFCLRQGLSLYFHHLGHPQWPGGFWESTYLHSYFVVAGNTNTRYCAWLFCVVVVCFVFVF